MNKKYYIVALLIILVILLIPKHKEKEVIPSFNVEEYNNDSLEKSNDTINTIIYSVQKEYAKDTSYIKLLDSASLYRIFSDYLDSYKGPISDCEPDIRRAR